MAVPVSKIPKIYRSLKLVGQPLGRVAYVAINDLPRRQRIPIRFEPDSFIVPIYFERREQFDARRLRRSAEALESVMREAGMEVEE